MKYNINQSKYNLKLYSLYINKNISYIFLYLLIIQDNRYIVALIHALTHQTHQANKIFFLPIFIFDKLTEKKNTYLYPIYRISKGTVKSVLLTPYDGHRMQAVDTMFLDTGTSQEHEGFQWVSDRNSSGTQSKSSNLHREFEIKYDFDSHTS